MMQRRFIDRRQAGQELSTKLLEYKDQEDAIVLGLPRGGVPVGYEVALALHLPLDVFMVRKLGLPGQEELAMGAIATGGSQIINMQIVKWSGISSHQLEEVIAKESSELQRREDLYRIGRPQLILEQRSVLLVDDGLATGSTMMAAVRALRQRQPKEIIVAVPVAAPDVCQELARYADKVTCFLTPPSLSAVGTWYQDFSQTSDFEVMELLDRAQQRSVAA